MAKPYLSRDFDPAIADYALRVSGKVALSAERALNPGAYTKERFPDLKGILVWHVGDAEAVAAARQIAEQTGAEIVWTDPAAVQQETLQTIRFAYKFFAQEEMGGLGHRLLHEFPRVPEGVEEPSHVNYFRDVVAPEARDRIIGVGNDRRANFNIDLINEFLTAATANIFEMLVLPVAFTLSRAVDIYGCDGMPFAAATKPWSHANEDGYMGKMAVMHRVHAGFRDRNYEEEFWSYCKDMEDILAAAEKAGAKVRTRSPSYVPALAKLFSF